MTTTMERPVSQETTRTEPTRSGPLFRPNIDIIEREDELVVLADMPGTCSDDIDIDIENGVLNLHAKVGVRQSFGTDFELIEYGIGDFHRSFQVSDTIDTTRVNAEYRDGVLMLHLPKTEAAKLRKIEVRAT